VWLPLKHKYRSGARGFSIKYHATESCVRKYGPRPVGRARSDDEQPYLRSREKEPAAEEILTLTQLSKVS